LLLDEPTNHLDLEAVFWLAQHLNAQRDLAVVVVTHDRWFLDEVSQRMWEVVDGTVQEYDGGYSAFMLAKAERARQASASEQRRNALIRKELAWLRRGPPARTSKPKFRIDAANELIRSEPEPRDQVELLAFAGARLGKTVFELHDVSLSFGERQLFEHAEWNVGPGDRIGIVGVNGAGKTTLVRLALGLVHPDSGRVVKGVTVKPAYLSQHMEELDPQLRVLAAVQEVAHRVEIGKGRELTASQLCERLGFGTDGQWTPVGDLSGGERRRLQLTRLLMAGPNVLILDEPTNDFDVETLAALEDLLDSFAGTILIVSHDRYFVERVADTCVGLLGDGLIRHLPAGIEQYLELRATAPIGPVAGADRAVGAASTSSTKQQRIDDRARTKELARLERLIERAEQQERELHDQLAEQATDHIAVTAIGAHLAEVVARKQDAEDAWLQVADE
jgi:ATP-binding cassette subfamily F protein uup